ncbi:MAG TPA: MBL fold metallo-hydrolase [Streptosporangiaceae bacterium]|jgi:glyoxylase-like metal-dependent hydrolase (beta-lactamase superfamily II)
MMQLQADDPEADWTTPGVYDVGAGVYRIPLPLPQDGLRAVNVYAVRDGDGLTLVDSGWAITEARDLLEQAVKLLDSPLAGVRRFLVTHVHRDHYTLAVTLRREFGMRISLGVGEAGTLRSIRDPAIAPWDAMLNQLRLGGAIDLVRQFERAPGGLDVSEWEDPDEWLRAPQEIPFEQGTAWQVHATPGHTRGHVVFVDPARDVMFAGDHVLPRITPSIGFEQNHAEYPLRDYLDSLRLVRALPDRRLLPAHGPVAPSVHHRVDELIEHHDTRLAQIDQTIDAGASTASESAHRLLWTRRGRQFGELDLLSQCLAVTETMAHLDVLTLAGRLQRSDVDGTWHYQRA